MIFLLSVCGVVAVLLLCLCVCFCKCFFCKDGESRLIDCGIAENLVNAEGRNLTGTAS